MIDMTVGEGPEAVEAHERRLSAIRHCAARWRTATRRWWQAFYAAMRDAAAWFNDPANFEELVKIYTPLISFGDLPGADELRRNWIKSVIPAYSKDLSVKRLVGQGDHRFLHRGQGARQAGRPGEGRLGQGALTASRDGERMSDLSLGTNSGSGACVPSEAAAGSVHLRSRVGQVRAAKLRGRRTSR